MAGKIREIWAAIAKCFDANSTPLRKAQIEAWINTHYAEKSFNSYTLGAQIYRSCVNVPSAQPYDTPKILFFNKEDRTYTRVIGSETSPLSIAEEAEIESGDKEDSAALPSGTFALEAHLRDYLASNLQVIEKGLTLWSSEPPSVEYMLKGRRVDILAKDLSGRPVVIELKVNKAYDRVIGQGLLYQSLIAAELGSDLVRVLIVAGEISEELRLACLRVKDVELFEYSISVQTTRVHPEGEE